MDVMDCPDCNGTGEDPSEWDGRCPFCNGLGEIDDPEGEWGDEDEGDYPDYSYLDEDELPAADKDGERAGAASGVEEHRREGVPVAEVGEGLELVGEAVGDGVGGLVSALPGGACEPVEEDGGPGKTWRSCFGGYAACFSRWCSSHAFSRWPSSHGALFGRSRRPYP
jgi:hypothetical protein